MIRNYRGLFGHISRQSNNSTTSVTCHYGGVTAQVRWSVSDIACVQTSPISFAKKQETSSRRLKRSSLRVLNRLAIPNKLRLLLARLHENPRPKPQFIQCNAKSLRVSIGRNRSRDAIVSLLSGRPCSSKVGTG